MKTINNPMEVGKKVKCIHYYEYCRTKWYSTFIAIFTYNEQIHLLKVDNPVLLNETLMHFGEICPENMSKALDQFKKLI